MTEQMVSGCLVVNGETVTREDLIARGLTERAADELVAFAKRLREKRSTKADIPRRIDTLRWTPAERAIQCAVDAVEAMPADVRLTAAVILLSQARENVADYVDGGHPVAVDPSRKKESP